MRLAYLKPEPEWRIHSWAEDAWMHPQQTLIPVISVVSKPLRVLNCRQH